MNETIDGFNFWTHPHSVGMRSLFYLLTPMESSFSSVKEVPKYVSKATLYFLLLVLVEAIVNILRGSKNKIPRWNDMFSSVAAGVYSLLPLLFMRSIEYSAYIYVHENYKIYELPWNHWMTWFITMLGVDLGYYWVHRMAHEVNFMWAAHQTHHSSEDYNLSTALRQSVMQRFTSWVFYLPMAPFLPPSQFLVHVQLNLLYQFWIHTEIVDRLGPLEWILNTPSHHRVHHGRNRYCIDKNYAGVFIIWDRMFGTFAGEKDDEEIAYGLTHPLRSWDPNYTQLFYYRYLFRRVKRAQSWSNAVKALIYGPGWQPGKPRLGVIADIPDVRTKQPKYNKSVSSLFMNLYLYVHFLCTIAANDFITNYRESFTLWTSLGVVIFILWTLSNIGLFYDQSSRAGWSELARCLVYLFLDGFMCYDRSCSRLLYVPRVIFVLSAAVLFFIVQRGNVVKVQEKEN